MFMEALNLVWGESCQHVVVTNSWFRFCLDAMPLAYRGSPAILSWVALVVYFPLLLLCTLSSPVTPHSFASICLPLFLLLLNHIHHCFLPKCLPHLLVSHSVHSRSTYHSQTHHQKLQLSFMSLLHCPHFTPIE